MELIAEDASLLGEELRDDVVAEVVFGLRTLRVLTEQIGAGRPC